MWRSLARFSPVAFSRPLLCVPLSTYISFLLGILVGQENHVSIFLRGSLLSLAGMHPSCEAVLVLQLPISTFLFEFLESTLH